MKPSFEALRPLWDRALDAEIGLAIPTNDPKALRQELLHARQSYDTDAYNDLMTFLPDGVGEVFIVKKTVELPDA